jgi:hypothetical protein
MKFEIMEWNLIAELSALRPLCGAGHDTQVGRTTRRIVMMAAFLAAMASTASAQSNPGDPLFCQPNEGVQFLIVNGGAGVFTADGDCYNNNANNDTTLSITTGQGGTLQGTVTGSSINYIYTPPTPTFTGLDTFSIPVTTSWNATGGPGSAEGTHLSRPGGPDTVNVTLNVIPSTTTLAVAGVPTLVPVPAGSLSGCTVGGSPGLGAAPAALYGCINRIIQTGAAPSHGSLSVSGTTIQYTPTPGYSGPDTFSYQAFGVNADGATALNSGTVSVQVTVTAASAAVASVPTLGAWGMAILCGVLLLVGGKALARRPV